MESNSSPSPSTHSKAFAMTQFTATPQPIADTSFENFDKIIEHETDNIAIEKDVSQVLGGVNSSSTSHNIISRWLIERREQNTRRQTALKNAKYNHYKIMGSPVASAPAKMQG